MSITITAFRNSPDQGRGLARDMRVRWALEEVGQPYRVRLVTFAEMREPEYRALHPFGQIPVYQEGDLVLFESGAIVLHIASRFPGLLPSDPDNRARALSWMFAALNTVEPPIVELEQTTLLEGDRAWHAGRRPLMEKAIRKRLDELAAWLGEGDWLEDRFAAGDLLMVTVLRRLEGMGILDDYPTLADYAVRGTTRPAYQRAFAAQYAAYASGGEGG